MNTMPSIPDLRAGELVTAWDMAAEAIDHDPMRPVRYGKCLRYFQPLDRGSHILEVGCGEGTGLRFARSLGFHRLTGCEISPERIKRAQAKLGNHADFVLVSDDGRLPFADGAFDAVFSAAVIEHVLDPAMFVAEIARVVRPGGCVVISSDCWQWRLLLMCGAFQSQQPIDKPMFPTSLLNLFRDRGLEVLHYEGFPLPGEEWRFLRILVSSLRRNRFVLPIKSKLRGVWRRLNGNRKATNPPVCARVRLPPQEEEHTMKGYALSELAPHQGLRAFLNLTFSDENVFHMTKKSVAQSLSGLGACRT